MKIGKISIKLVACASMVLVTACSSGGGGTAATGAGGPSGGSGTPATPAPTPPAPPPPPPVTQIVGPPGIATMGGSPLATSTTPRFSTTMPNGTVFSLTQSAVRFTPTSAMDANIGSGTLTFRNVTSVVNGMSIPGPPQVGLVDLNVPSIGLNATQLNTLGVTNLQSNGDRIRTVITSLDYTFLGYWTYLPSPSTTSGHDSHLVAGFQTPPSGVPSSGTGTYAGSGITNINTGFLLSNGGAMGKVYVANADGTVSTGFLYGNANVSVNFGSGTVSGNLTGMTAQTSTTTAPWNNVGLTGTLSGATVSGSTSTTGATGDFGLSSAATGVFNGALYGPTGQEIGAVWSLSETTSNGGKSALGAFGAKQ